MSQVNEDLNLVLPAVVDVVTHDEQTREVTRLWAYHTPISRQVFEANYRVLSATKAAIFSKGGFYAMDVGPRVAALTLKDEGLKDAAARGSVDELGKPIDDATGALLAEIRRLTNILVPGSAGWDLLPVDAAIGQGHMTQDDWSEVEAAIVFFTCHCAMARRAEKAKQSRATASLLRGSITSLVPLEFAASLPGSTPVKTSQVAASSVPS